MATATDAGARRAEVRRTDATHPQDLTRRVTRSDGESEPRVTVTVNMAQVARVVTGLLWVAWAAWESTEAYVQLASIVETIVAGLGLVAVACALTLQTDSARQRLDRCLIAGSIGLVVVLPLAAAGALGYLTDELAYDQAAAASLLHGVNPYTVDFTPALHAFGVGTGTMTLHGTFEPYLSYPALSFLLYLPAVAALGAQSYAGWLMNLLAWGVAGVVMWRVLDARVRPWVPVLLALPPLLGSVIGGVTDPLFIPLEMVAMCTWQRFSDPSLGRWWRWAGPISLGLACAVKQQPWLVVPFLLAAVAYEAHLRGVAWWRETVRYATLTAGAFLLPNLPFIVWNPHAWVDRLLTPFDGALVPMGIGPASLMQPFSIGGGALGLFTLAAVAALLAALALLHARYGRVRQLLPLLAAAPLFLSTRSFASYFLFMIPLVIVNTATLQRLDHVPRPRLYRPLAITAAACSLLAVSAAGAALAIRAPLRIDVSTATATSRELTVVARVVNTSDTAVAPHFFLSKGAYYNQILTTVSGPAHLAAHTTATYEFTTPLLPATPHPGDHLQLQAGTLTPNTISASGIATVTG